MHDHRREPHRRSRSPLPAADASKSKSLPPRQQRSRERGSHARNNGAARERVEETPEEREERHFKRKLKAMSEEERAKALARREKFKDSKGVSDSKAKKISLKSVHDVAADTPEASDDDEEEEEEEAFASKKKRDLRDTKLKRLVSDEVGDSISLNVDDTMDMFEEDGRSKSKKARVKRSQEASPGNLSFSETLRFHC